ncbi:MAG TPA: hypothetical protein VGK73_36290 [Polyangiaceae bacterium]
MRIDPFNLLLEGQLGLELEVAIIKYLSVELVPVFVVNDSPPTFGYVTGRDEHVTRSSNGWGPFAGTSIDVGIWPEGKALKGYVLRAIFTNYSYRYEAWDLEPQPFDRVDHVERKLFAYFGSHSRWGAFTLAGGFGIGAELNSERRCFVDNAQGYAEPTTNCAQKELLIKLTRERLPRNFLPVADLYGGLGGVQLLVRFSLGVVF